jgi:regulator of protease activity HflC (stomatin/prohibitin superfamily)
MNLFLLVLSLLLGITGTILIFTRMVGWGLLAIGIGAVCLIMSMTTVVGTRNIGVVTSFGKPVGEPLGNGLHWKAPWHKVTDLDGTIHPDAWTGDKAIQIRIGNGSIAAIDTNVRWRIVPARAGSLFLDYRSVKGVKDSGGNDVSDVNGIVRESLVKYQLQAALNEVYGEFDPLAVVKGGSAVSVDSLSGDVQEALLRRVNSLGGPGGQQVEILSATTPLIHLDPDTQKKINDYQIAIADTRIAQQRIETNKAAAKANEELAKSVQDENVLKDKCLNTQDAMQKAGQPLPPGGLGCLGGQPPSVIVGAP